jgi:Flp pilus assembly protein TadG
MVEFALIAPLFFLLVLVIIEGGRFILYYQALSNATREGARYAIVHGSNSSCPSGPMAPGAGTPDGCYDPTGANVVQRVKDSAFGLFGSGVNVTPVWGALGNGRESDVTVTAAYTYRTLIPLLPIPPITVTAESTLVVNN